MGEPKITPPLDDPLGEIKLTVDDFTTEIVEGWKTGFIRRIAVLGSDLQVHETAFFWQADADVRIDRLPNCYQLMIIWHEQAHEDILLTFLPEVNKVQQYHRLVEILSSYFSGDYYRE